MHPRDIILIGGSAGAIPALQGILELLPSNLPAAVFVVLHRGVFETPYDAIARHLSRYTRMKVQSATDAETFRSGVVYVCPSNYHLHLENTIMRVEKSPKENLWRPSIDVLFRSAATIHGRRTIGVLLSGMAGGSDGVAGLWYLTRRGGIGIAQEPSDAVYPEMPRMAIDEAGVDLVLPAAGIAAKLIDLAGTPARPPIAPIKVLIVEDEVIVATNLKERLTKLGFEVLAAVSTGESAVQWSANNPDLVLMDIYLAGEMSGINAARQIWEKHQIPVVYLTAYTDRDTLDAATATENYGYVVKPFHTEAVRTAIELALARRQKQLRHN